VLLESLDAEELGADGLFGVRKGIDRGAEVADEGEDNSGLLARRHGVSDLVKREAADVERVVMTGVG